MQNKMSSRRAKAHKPVRRERPPTLEQVNMLADAMPTVMLRGFTLCAAWSGLRLSEIAALEWRDVHDGSTPTTARLHVRHGKGDKERVSVILKPGLDAMLECAPRGEWVGHVFLNAEQRPFQKAYINRYWIRARKQTGLEHLWFHDLRKFCGTWLIDHGMSDLDVALQLGHTDSLGRPNAELVRTTYGFANVDKALARIERGAY